MLWIGLVVVLFVCGIVLAQKSKSADNVGLQICGVIFAAIGGVSFVVTVLIAVAYTDAAITDKANLAMYQKDIAIHAERYESQKVMIMAEVAKYPLEAGLLEKFNPKILLSLPEIKSDTLIMEMINRLLEIENKIYETRLRITTTQRDLDAYKNRWFYPVLVSPEY